MGRRVLSVLGGVLYGEEGRWMGRRAMLEFVVAVQCKAQASRSCFKMLSGNSRLAVLAR